MALVVLSEDLDSIPAPTKQLTTVYNSELRELNMHTEYTVT